MFCSKCDFLWYRLYVALHKCRDIPGDPSAAPKVNRTLLGNFDASRFVCLIFTVRMLKNGVTFSYHFTPSDNILQEVSQQLFSGQTK